MSYPTIVEFFRQTAERFADKAAVRLPRGKDYEQLSYGELKEGAERLAGALRRLGIAEGDRVILLSRPRLEWPLALLGILHAGAIAVPLDAQLSPGEAERIIPQADAKAAIVEREHLPAVKKLLTISMDPLEAPKPKPKQKGVLSLEELLREGEAPSEPELELDPEALAVIAFTSGTTGDAKGVMLSHRNFSADVQACLERMPIGPEDVILSIAPWYHSYGLTAGLLVPFWTGATAVHTSEYRELPRIMKETETTVVIGVPKLYHLMYERVMERVRANPLGRVLLGLAPRLVGRRVKRALASPKLRFFVSGGAPLDPEVARGFRRLGIGIIEGYGLTEAAPVVAFSYPFDRKVGTVGSILPGMEVKLHEPDEEGVGEILVRGPNVMRGYYKRPELTREVIDEEGWLHTGDLGSLDEEGYIYIKGRRKNVIVLESGKNVYPEEVEWELARLPYVEEVLVKRGYRQGREVVQALIYPNWERLGLPEQDLERARELIWEQIKAASRGLAPYKRIRSKEDIIIVPQPFEKTTTQDIKRYLYQHQ